MKDFIVVGGGLGGLSAAWRLRHWDIALLESGSRVGGRIRSERRGAYWLNWGGHVFAGPGTSTDALLHEAGITAAQVDAWADDKAVRITGQPSSVSDISARGGTEKRLAQTT